MKGSRETANEREKGSLLAACCKSVPVIYFRGRRLQLIQKNRNFLTQCFHLLRTVFSWHSWLRFRQGCTLGNSPHSHWNTHSLYQSQRNTCKCTQTHTQTTCSHSGISTTGLINYCTAAPLSRFSTACCFSAPSHHTASSPSTPLSIPVTHMKDCKSLRDVWQE